MQLRPTTQVPPNRSEDPDLDFGHVQVIVRIAFVLNTCEQIQAQIAMLRLFYVFEKTNMVTTMFRLFVLATSTKFSPLCV